MKLAHCCIRIVCLLANELCFIDFLITDNGKQVISSVFVVNIDYCVKKIFKFKLCDALKDL